MNLVLSKLLSFITEGLFIELRQLFKIEIHAEHHGKQLCNCTCTVAMYYSEMANSCNKFMLLLPATFPLSFCTWTKFSQSPENRDQDWVINVNYLLSTESGTVHPHFVPAELDAFFK